MSSELNDMSHRQIYKNKEVSNQIAALTNTVMKLKTVVEQICSWEMWNTKFTLSLLLNFIFI